MSTRAYKNAKFNGNTKKNYAYTPEYIAHRFTRGGSVKTAYCDHNYVGDVESTFSLKRSPAVYKGASCEIVYDPRPDKGPVNISIEQLIPPPPSEGPGGIALENLKPAQGPVGLDLGINPPVEGPSGISVSEAPTEVQNGESYSADSGFARAISSNASVLITSWRDADIANTNDGVASLYRYISGAYAKESFKTPFTDSGSSDFENQTQLGLGNLVGDRESTWQGTHCEISDDGTKAIIGALQGSGGYTARVHLLEYNGSKWDDHDERSAGFECSGLTLSRDGSTYVLITEDKLMIFKWEDGLSFSEFPWDDPVKGVFRQQLMDNRTVALNSDGTVLAIATSERVDPEDSMEVRSSHVRVYKLTDPADPSSWALAIKFKSTSWNSFSLSDDGTKLALNLNNSRCFVYDISGDSEVPYAYFYHRNKPGYTPLNFFSGDGTQLIFRGNDTTDVWRDLGGDYPNRFLPVGTLDVADNTLYSSEKSGWYIGALDKDHNYFASIGGVFKLDECLIPTEAPVSGPTGIDITTA